MKSENIAIAMISGGVLSGGITAYLTNSVQVIVTVGIIGAILTGVTIGVLEVRTK